MEGQQLQGDDAQDALQAVYALRYFDGATGVSDGLLVVFVADDDGTPLQMEQDSLRRISGFLHHLNPHLQQITATSLK